MKKYLSLFLIIILMISLFSCAEKQPDPIPQAELEYMDFEVQYIRTYGFFEEEQYPAVKIIRSKEQLNDYLERSETKDLADACKRYDDTYFQDRILVMVLLQESSGSNRHRVQKVFLENDKELVVEIDAIIPEVGTDDMAEWHILLEPEAGVDVTNEEDITVFLDGKNITESVVLAEYSKGYANMSLTIPENWEYEIEDQEGASSFGINFWPSGREEGKIKVCYFTDGFGVCGTGLTNRRITLGSYIADQGIYNDGSVWSFMVLRDTPGHYVIFNEGNGTWWKDHGEKVMEILQSIQVAKGCLAENRAVAVAKKKCIIEYDELFSSYDYTTGVWTFTFRKDTPYASQEITVDPDGKVGDRSSITQQ